MCFAGSRRRSGGRIAGGIARWSGAGRAFPAPRFALQASVDEVRSLRYFDASLFAFSRAATRTSVANGRLAWLAAFTSTQRPGQPGPRRKGEGRSRTDASLNSIHGRARFVTEFQNPRGVSPSLADAQNLKFERADWTAFRTIEGLQQKAGVAKGLLRRLVLKELTDNALDTETARRGSAKSTAAISSRTKATDSIRMTSPACSASTVRWYRPSSCACRPAARLATACAWSPVPCWRLAAS